MSRDYRFLCLLAGFVMLISISGANAQTCTTAGSNNFFSHCSASSPFTSAGNYTFDIKNGDVLTINGSVTINGTLTLDFNGNNGQLVIAPGGSLKATNVEITNPNPTKVKQLDVDGTFQVTGTLDLNNGLFDLDGTGSISAGTITGAGNTSCSTEGDCPGITTQNPCSPAGSGLCAESGVLPVQLTEFNVSVFANIVRLNWQTESELNFDYFSIERSQNGTDFIEIAKVAGNGTTSQAHKYDFKDQFPLIGKSYYRLTSVDFDGYRETFEVRSITYDGEKSARVFPNPTVNGKLTVELTFTPTDEVRLVVCDITGVEVEAHSINEQLSSFSIDLAPGTYLLKVSTGGNFSKVIRAVVR